MANFGSEAKKRLIDLAATWSANTNQEIGAEVRRGMRRAIWLVQTGEETEAAGVAHGIVSGRINLEEGSPLILTDPEKEMFRKIAGGGEENELMGWLLSGELTNKV